MSIVFSGGVGSPGFTGYVGTINTSGVNYHFNPNNLGAPDTIQFTDSQNLYDPNTQVDINGTGPVDFVVEERGILTSQATGYVGNTYDYVIINVNGDLYMFLHDDGVEVGTYPFKSGNRNPLQTEVYCFVRGTQILTECGQSLVENLSVDDLIMTINGLKKIIWVGSRKMGRGRKFKYNPIRINTGALGPGLPSRDLLVSPQHRILVNAWRAELMFGVSEILVAAKHLVNDTDIRVATDLEEFEYFHILFDSHQTIFSEGLPTESFHPGDMAMRSLSEDSRAEVLELFPELANDVASYGPSTHRSLKAFEAKALQSA